MATGDDIYLNVQATNTERVSPMSISSTWSEPNTDATEVDAATITNPDSEITAVTRHHLISNGQQGTHLVPRFKWGAGVTVTTPPRYAAFGRTGASDAYVRLRTKAGALYWQPSTTNYTTDGTYNYTIPDLSADPWDRMGCDDVLIGNEQEAAYSGATEVLGTLQTKPI